MDKSYAVHAALEPIAAWVDSSIFDNLQSPEGTWVKAKIFGITCLKGRVPTFEVLTNDGYVFSDVPPHLIRWKIDSPSQSVFPLKSLVYNNCLSTNFSLSHFPTLAEKEAFAFLKAEEQYVAAKYWFSIDFYECNNWYHCLKLDNGQFAFIPSHKIVFPTGGLPSNHVFPPYQKLRQEFSV